MKNGQPPESCSITQLRPEPGPRGCSCSQGAGQSTQVWLLPPMPHLLHVQLQVGRVEGAQGEFWRTSQPGAGQGSGSLPSWEPSGASWLTGSMSPTLPTGASTGRGPRSGSKSPGLGASPAPYEPGGTSQQLEALTKQTAPPPSSVKWVRMHQAGVSTVSTATLVMRTTRTVTGPSQSPFTFGQEHRGKFC